MRILSSAIECPVLLFTLWREDKLCDGISKSPSILGVITGGDPHSFFRTKNITLKIMPRIVLGISHFSYISIFQYTCKNKNTTKLIQPNLITILFPILRKTLRILFLATYWTDCSFFPNFLGRKFSINRAKETSSSQLAQLVPRRKQPVILFRYTMPCRSTWIIVLENFVILWFLDYCLSIISMLLV